MRGAKFLSDHAPNLVVLLVCSAILLGALVLSPALPGSRSLRLLSRELPQVCTFHTLTGIPCPGCGLTRSLVAAVRGDFAGSWSSHRLGLLTLFYLLLQIFYRLGLLICPDGVRHIYGRGIWLNRGILLLAGLYAVNWLFTLVL